MTKNEARKQARERVGQVRLEVKRLPSLRPGERCRACGEQDCTQRYERRVTRAGGPFGRMVLGAGHSWDAAIDGAERLVRG